MIHLWGQCGPGTFRDVIAAYVFRATWERVGDRVNMEWRLQPGDLVKTRLKPPVLEVTLQAVYSVTVSTLMKGTRQRPD
jgi:hypothetical protein